MPGIWITVISLAETEGVCFMGQFSAEIWTVELKLSSIWTQLNLEKLSGLFISHAELSLKKLQLIEGTYSRKTTKMI